MHACINIFGMKSNLGSGNHCGKSLESYGHVFRLPFPLANRCKPSCSHPLLDF